MTTERIQISFRLDPDVHAALKELAGPVPLAPYVEGLIKRVVTGRGGGVEQRQPTLPVRAPQPVQVVGLEKLEQPIADIHELVAEVLRAVHEHRAYDRLRDAAMDGALEEALEPPSLWRRLLGGGAGAREISRAALSAAARDEAAREVAKWRKPNGSA
jgi:hypothetical protein